MSHRPKSAGRPASSRRTRAQHDHRLHTTMEINPGERDPDEIRLSQYEHRKYTPAELKEAHAFFRKLANLSQGGSRQTYLDKKTFHKRMHKVAPYVSAELRELLRHFLDRDDDARIDEAEFVAGWGFVKEELELLDNIENRYVLEDLSHNLPEQTVGQLIAVYEALVSDQKLKCFDALEFGTKVRRILGYTESQVAGLLHMVGEDMAAVTFKDFIKACMFFHDGDANSAPHDDSVHAKRELTASQMREAKAIYRSFDINKDGVVDSGEMHARMADFGWTDVEIMSIVADMDTDADGKITLEEFMSAYLDFF
eukprot:SAG22_NODE_126_length_18820_cov_10.207788_14_plen_311_part_00